MKFLLFSTSAEGAQVLKRIELEGNEVGIYIKDKRYKKAWDGLLPKVNPDKFVDKDTVIIFDMSGNGEIADEYKSKGHLVYGASSFADRLEDDRDFGLSMMESSGIRIPKYKTFSNFSEGIQFVHAVNKPMVFKPSGDMPCKLTFVSEDPLELERYMKFVEKKFGEEISSFILQEFVKGVVVSSELFCNGNKFLHPPNHTVEVKKFMNGDIGPSTGCSGNITWPCGYDAIIRDGVIRIEEECVKNEYVGQIDLNVVASTNGIYGLEWTPRFGYDATPTLLALLKGEVGKFFSDITRGQLNEIEMEDAYAGSVRVTVPPYPAEPEGDPEVLSPSIGIPILGLENHDNACYFYEVMLDEDGLSHSSGIGVIMCVVGVSSNYDDVLSYPYEVIEDAKIPDKQYRTDLEEVLSDMIEEVVECQ